VEQQDIDLQVLNQNNGKLTVTHKYNKTGQYDISAYITTPITVSASDIKNITNWLKNKDTDITLTSETLSAQINIIEGVPCEVEEKEQVGLDVELKGLNLPDEIIVGERTAIDVIVKNNSTINIRNCSLILEVGRDYKDEKNVSIYSQREGKTTFYWKPEKPGSYKITVTLKYEGDKNPKNNFISREIKVQGEVSSQLPSEDKTRPKKTDQLRTREKEPQQQTKPQEGIVVKLSFLEFPRDIVAGQRTRIQVQAENTSSEYVRNCKVCLEAEDGFKDEKALMLAANANKKYVFYWSPRKSGKLKLSVYLQSEPQANISAETLAVFVEVKEPEPIDVELTEISLPKEIIVGKRTAIQVVAKNNSTTNVSNCSLTLEIGKDFKDEKTVSITAQREKKTTFYWTPEKPEDLKIIATLKCEEDKNTKNNSVSRDIQVKAAN